MRLRTANLSILIVIALTSAFFIAPGTADHVPLVKVSTGAPLSTDFNGDDGDFETTVIPPRPGPANPSWEWGAFDPDRPRPINNPSWEWGAPTSGPGAAYSGANAWATNLAGPHNDSECSAILSPPIDLSGATTASFSFMEWRHFERTSTTGTLWDAGMLFVTGDGGDTFTRLGAPTPAYSGTASITARACLDNQPSGTAGYGGPSGTTPPAPTYSQVSASLDAFVGGTVQVVIAFGADGGGVRDGWYIDDFSLTIDGTTTVEDFESGDGGFSVAGVRPLPPNGPGVAHSGSKVWATHIDGEYNDSECSAIASPPITIPDGSTASVSFMQWRHFERTSSTGSLWDAGRLFVTTDGGLTFARIDAPTPAYDTGSLHSMVARCLDGVATTGTNAYGGPVGTTVPAPTYSPVSADLSAFAGQTVQFVLSFGSETGGVRSGWYIDDFAVTINGTTTVEDFESGDGGFTVMATGIQEQLGWSHVEPDGVTGPAATVGDGVWATGGNGEHGISECAWIESPPIDLAGPTGTGLPSTQAVLRWQQWYRAGSSTSAGVVQISTDGGSTYTIIEPTTGYPANPSNTQLNACTGHRDQETGAFAGFIDANGAAMIDYEADLTPFLGNVTTVRFLFASTTSTSTNPGWYIDNVAVETFAYVGEPHTGELPIPDPGSQNAPLWTSGGEQSSWGYGVVTDPSTNSDMIRGQVGYKTNLAGNSNMGECSWIQSPPIPGAALVGNPTLVFEHAYRIPGTSVDVAWGGGLVMASGDGGLTWEYLDLPEYDRPLDYSGGNPACFTGFGAPLDGNVFGGAHHTQYETVSVDLSAYIDDPSVTIRFVYGTVVFAYEGWFIRDVQVGGMDLLA